jgi:thioredoxin-related protein
MMTREVYPDKGFIEFSRSQVFVRVFEDTQPEGARLARKYDVLGFPTLIILDSRGQEVDRIEGALRAKPLIEELQLIFKSAKSNRISI